jgi:hypothetical protein
MSAPIEAKAGNVNAEARLISRRHLLQAAPVALWPAAAAGKKRIAVIATEYRLDSHADVIAGRLIKGYEYEGKRREPAVQVVSMYTDQVPHNDLSRGLAAKYGFKIYPTVRQALTFGGDQLAVDSVVLIGEHGNYPDNEKGQKLYPRYPLYQQIVEVFRASIRTVPVYCDKHLSTDWTKAKQMYDESRELRFPLMAGSSLPVSWRRPLLELDSGAPVERAVTVFYGGKEAYGFHALEALQCMVERRNGGETGIASVGCVEGAAVWSWTDANPWSGRLLDAALARSETKKPGSPRENAKAPILFRLEYRSGLAAAVYILNGHCQDCTFAAQIRGRTKPVSTEIWLQPGRPYSHFSALVHYIEQMILTGREPYPPERTLLTTGALAALMEAGGRTMETPHLAIAYRPPSHSLFARGPVPALEAKA